MLSFWILVEKILPLYLLILAGYIAARLLGTDRHTIGKLLLYGISPALVFMGALRIEVSLANYSLPVIVFLVASLVSLSFFFVSKVFYAKPEASLMAYAAGSSNTGYFGLPVIVAVLGLEALDLAVIANLGMVFFECTIGFYLAACGNFSIKQSFYKVVRLPHLYLLLTGIFLNATGVNYTWFITAFEQPIKGSYTLLGMMLIGIGLASTKVSFSDLRFAAFCSLAKFLIWPALMSLLLYLSRGIFQIHTEQAAQILLIMSIVPVAANTVVIAAELDLNPGKAAFAVILSTVLALAIIPLYCAFA